ncbi:MAG: PqqD family protein [Candidatus Omnitrophota bacterium]|jgi:succinate dehydrogenase/fumarate reductase flavoprotein subunit
MIKPETVLLKKKHVVCTALPQGGGAVLLNMNNKYFYTLNKAAFRLWECIDGKRAISGVAGEIMKEYGINRQQAMANITTQVKQFIREDLVETKA